MFLMFTKKKKKKKKIIIIKLSEEILPLEGEKMQKCILAPLPFRKLPIVCGCQDKQ